MSYVFRGVILPDDLKESIDAFIERGRPTGDFLKACIDNDLMQAFGRADEVSLAAMPAIVGYLYNECPMGSHGRTGAWRDWIDKKAKERSAV
jgi:hypothetical protein